MALKGIPSPLWIKSGVKVGCKYIPLSIILPYLQLIL